MSSPVTFTTPRRVEKQHIVSLNQHFKNYVEKVRLMRDQCKKTENNVSNALLQSLENEIFELKTIYERELNNVRQQLDQVIADRNIFHMDASKHGAMATELRKKLAVETENRKKLEIALVDSHRLLSEKDSLLQELRITIAQHQNAHLETTKESDAFRSQLTTLSRHCDAETKRCSDLEASLQKLSSQLEFERQVNNRDQLDSKNRLLAAERAIDIADEKLKEHENIDEKMHQQIENIRKQCQNEFQQFQEQSERAYQNQLLEHKTHLEKESAQLAQKNEENIHLKAVIEEMNVKIGKLDSKCISINDQNNNLIHNLEMERRASAAAVSKLEHNLRDMHENLNKKVRELNDVRNAYIPIDLEIEAFANLLQSEEQRLKVALANPPAEMLMTSRGEMLPSRTNYVNRSLPASPCRGSGSGRMMSGSRPKSTPTDVQTSELPYTIPSTPATKPSNHLPHINGPLSFRDTQYNQYYRSHGVPSTRIYFRHFSGR